MVPIPLYYLAWCYINNKVSGQDSLSTLQLAAKPFDNRHKLELIGRYQFRHCR